MVEALAVHDGGGGADEDAGDGEGTDAVVRSTYDDQRIIANDGDAMLLAQSPKHGRLRLAVADVVEMCDHWGPTTSMSMRMMWMPIRENGKRQWRREPGRTGRRSSTHLGAQERRRVRRESGRTGWMTVSSARRERMPLAVHGGDDGT